MHAAPFRPFVLHLADGRAFTIDHPDFVSIDRRGREVTVYLPDNALQMISLMMVTSIEATTNGEDDTDTGPTTNGAPA